MAMTPKVLEATLRSAVGFLNTQRFTEARDVLAPVARAMPDAVDARYLLGAALQKLGDAAGAERELKAALAADPMRQDVAVELARLLNALGRPADAISTTEPLAARREIRPALLAERAAAFQALGLLDEMVAVRERLAALNPTSVASRHNLASALGDAGHAARAEAAARVALRAGDLPETWLVLARALQGQNRYDAAEDAFREALRRRPLYVEALRDLAQLVWMRTGELAPALAVLDVPAPPPERRMLRAIQARLHEYAGDARGGHALLLRDGLAGDPALELAAAHLATRFDPQAAMDHARRAAALAPGDERAQRQLAESHLALGAPHAALALTEALLASHPLDQGLIALQWAAWRLLDDPRAGELYDYARMVLAQPIDTPPAWATLDAYLDDLGNALRGLHRLRSHPIDQSLRNGTQTSVNLLRSDDPAIRAFVAAIDRPIRRYLAFLGQGGDRLRARNTSAYRIAGMWSVRLRREGYHVDHVHSEGWLSSACHIVLPSGVGMDGDGDGDGEGSGREGWIQFGAPGIPTVPMLGAEFAVRPRPGQLVMFPSYMWHGTVPFPGDGERITIAFDLVPG